MSVKVMGRVWDTDLPGNLKLVLLAYADAAEHDGTDIWPGRERIAAMCTLSIPTIDRLTRELLELGYLVQILKGRKGQRASYLIPLEKLGGSAYQSDSQTNSEDSLSPTEESLSPDAAKPINADSPPVLDPSSTPVLKNAAAPRNPHWDALVDVFGEPSNGQRSLYGRVVQLVKTHPAAEVPRRAARLAEMWGPEKVTVASLEKHWTRFDAAIGNVTDSDVDAFTAAREREETIKRLSG